MAALLERRSATASVCQLCRRHSAFPSGRRPGGSGDASQEGRLRRGSGRTRGCRSVSRRPSADRRASVVLGMVLAAIVDQSASNGHRGRRCGPQLHDVPRSSDRPVAASVRLHRRPEALRKNPRQPAAADLVDGPQRHPTPPSPSPRPRVLSLSLSREHALPLSAEDPVPCRHRDPATAATEPKPRRNSRQIHPFHPPSTNDTAPWLITTRRSRSLSPASWLLEQDLNLRPGD